MSQGIEQFIQLQNRIDGYGIIAAGPLVKQPMTQPFRIVLRHLKGDGVDSAVGQFVVHDQVFSHWPSSFGNSYFHHGHYYTEDDFPKAVAKFAERLATFAYQCESLPGMRPTKAPISNGW